MISEIKIFLSHARLAREKERHCYILYLILGICETNL
jgi:hypothetical protein